MSLTNSPFWFSSGATSAGGGSFYDYTIDQSLRFNDDDNAYLNITYGGSSTSTALGTFSWWMKRSTLGGSQDNIYFEASGYGGIQLRSDKLAVNSFDSSNTQVIVQTDAVLRDVSSWYHCVVSINGTAGTIKFYINGVEQAQTVTNGSLVSGRSWDMLGYDSRTSFRINNTGSNKFDGYLAEYYYIDGQALDATSFGETINGIWVPKAYSGSYGNNGFYLDFSDNSTASALGTDSSGNSNDFSVNNLATTDQVPDSPTNNFATLNSLSKSVTANWTLSEGNLHCAAPSGSNWQSVRGTHGVSSGKWYWEVEFDAGTMTEIFCGIMNQNTVPHATNDYDDTTGVVLFYNHVGGEVRYNGTLTDNNYGTLVAGDILGVALNMDDKQLSFYKNGSAIVTNFDIDITGITTVVPAAASDGFSVVLKFNFGQDSANVSSANSDENGIGTFEYAPPSGFLALCSANLPEPTIGPNSTTQSDDYFNTVLYTGNGTAIGSGGNAITGVGFQPDWVWIKERSGAASHGLYDVVRGVTEQLESDTTAAETTESEGLATFGTDGFTVGSLAQVNTNTDTYVGWNWKAGGTAVSNTDGTITSSVSANQDAGFSIATWTGTGSAGATVGHGLGAVPDVMIVKKRAGGTAYGWAVWHKDANDNSTDFLVLNTTAAQADQDVWNDTAPTSTVLSLGANNYSNYPSGATYVGYFFKGIEGHSKFGKYVGNGNADGTFVYTGFRPAFVMVKRTDSSGGWHMFDNKRANTYNKITVRLEADNTDAENTNGPPDTDLLSNGFKLRTSFDNINVSGGTYVYIAFAEVPFKYSNAR